MKIFGLSHKVPKDWGQEMLAGFYSLGIQTGSMQKRSSKFLKIFETIDTEMKNTPFLII